MENRQIARGLTTAELNTLHQGIVKQATLGAISKMPTSLMETQDGTESLSLELKLADLTAGYGDTSILYNLRINEIIPGIHSLVNKTGTPGLTE